jgi:hypothetical protein
MMIRPEVGRFVTVVAVNACLERDGGQVWEKIRRREIGHSVSRAQVTTVTNSAPWAEDTHGGTRALSPLSPFVTINRVWPEARRGPPGHLQHAAGRGCPVAEREMRCHWRERAGLAGGIEGNQIPRAMCWRGERERRAMKLRDAIIAWNPRGDIEVAPLAETRGTGRFDHLRNSGGGVYSEVREARGEAAKVMALAEWHVIVLRDRVDPKKAHNAFLKIDEYRDAIAPDIVRTLH